MSDTTDTTTARFGRIALILAVLIALAAVGIKLWPQGPLVKGLKGEGVSNDQSQLGASGPASSQADIGASITALEARLKANPNDAEGWRMLGWSFFGTERFAEAATAYKRAATLKPDNGDYWSSLGEALVMAGPGSTFPPDARAAFDKAVALNAKDPRARYFIGVSKDMGGDHKGAIDDWIALLKDTPAGAPWENDVRRTAEAVAAKEKIDIKARLAEVRPALPMPGAAGAAIPGPNAEQMRSASALPPGQQEAMVSGMVESLAGKLKANPKNVDGWVMLMRSYATLGRSSDAATAYRTAVAANPEAKAQLDEAAKTLGVAR